jgi:hypothetical protein
MTFKDLESQFWQIKGKHSAGLMSDEKFKSDLAQLRLQDDQKQWWTINPKDGSWLVYQSQKWVPGVPPEKPFKEEIPPPPPPPPPSRPIRREAGNTPKPPQMRSVQMSETDRPRPKRKPHPRIESSVGEQVKDSDQKPVSAKAPRPRPKAPGSGAGTSEPKSGSPENTRPVPPAPPPPPRKKAPDKVNQAMNPPPIRKHGPDRNPAKSAPKYCPICRAEVGVGDKFCGDCGQILTSKSSPGVHPNKSTHTKREHSRQQSDSGAEQIPAGRIKAVKPSWILGGIIFIGLLISSSLIDDELYSKVVGKYGLHIFHVVSAIIIFNFILIKNGIKLRFNSLQSPGKDIFLLAFFGLIMVMITKGLGEQVFLYSGEILLRILGESMSDNIIIYLYYGITYLLFTLSGILLSYPGVKLARRFRNHS